MLLRYLLLLHFGTLGIKTVWVKYFIYCYTEVFESCNGKMAKAKGTKRRK